MKIVVPYAGVFPQQAMEAIDSLAIGPVDPYTYYVGHDDSAYFDLLARLWREKESIIIVEHDIIVTEAAIIGLLECNRTWCSCPYPWYNTTLHGLGCTKFDQQIMGEFPKLFDEIANVSNEIHPAKHWCNIDDRIRRYFAQYQRNDHQHTDVVGHLRPYASHGCVVRCTYHRFMRNNDMGDVAPSTPAPAADTLTQVASTVDAVVAVAESGTTTSEFKALIGTALADVLALAVSFGVHLTAVQQTDILSIAGLVTAAAVSYIVSRGIRKSGTTA